MSEPSTDPLPQKADIPVQRLSRPDSQRYSRRLSPALSSAISHGAAAGLGDGGDGAGSSSGSGSSAVPKPSPAVIKPDKAPTTTTSPVDGGADLIASIERGPFSNTNDASQNPSKPTNIEQFLPERNPYAPSGTDRFKETLRTAPYVAKVKLYRTTKGIIHLPEHIVRMKRRLLAPTPSLVAPVTTPSDGRQAALKKKRFNSQKCLGWVFTMEMWQFYGCLFTLGLNAGFAYWVWVHVHVYIDPHTWRQRPLVTSSLSTWGAFTSLEIWIAIMLGIWNVGGSFLMLVGFILAVGAIYRLSGLKWVMERKKPTTATGGTQKPFKSSNNPLMTILSLLFLMLILWPILASTIPAPRSRVDRYPKRCEGGEWDFKVILDGRVQPKNLTKGRITIRELKGEAAGEEVMYLTADYVDTTWIKTEEVVVLNRMMAPPKEVGGVFVSEVTLRFPYMETFWEEAGWKSLPDVKRERGGNYTAILTDVETGRNRTVEGNFPYLDDQNSGLRLDELGLIPDVKRSWRTMASTAESCPWGPDAKLLENTDPGARNLVGEGHTVLLTDMTKFGRCSELTVCANRRRQTVDGLPWAQGGEDVKQALDAMLVVPLGLILVEQIRWGSCCGDGFEPYKAGPA